MEIDPLENRIIEAEDFENVFKSEDNKLPDLNQMPINASSEFLVTKGYVDEGLLVGLETSPLEAMTIAAYQSLHQLYSVYQLDSTYSQA